MRNMLSVSGAATCAVAMVVGLGATPAAAEEPSRYIVVLKDSVTSPGAVAREHSASAGAQVRHVYRSALKGYSARLPASRVARLKADPRVSAVVLDALGGPAGKGGNKPGSGGNTTTVQTLPTGVDRINGNTSPVATVDADVAVLDSGVYGGHPDLNVAGGYWCGAGTASGYDADTSGHGTHVAGTVAARNNSIGVVGVAPGARIWSLRLPDRNGDWYLSALVCAVDWIAEQREPDATGTRPVIEAANMSVMWQNFHLGFPGLANDDCGVQNNDPLHKSICKARALGTTFIAAAGNDAADTQQRGVPGGYGEVITVSALADFDGAPGGLIGRANTAKYCRADVDDTAADFSNYGTDVDIMAPGVCIRSTLNTGGYGFNSGTSMAAPHVTGAAALLAAQDRTATPDSIQQRLVATGTSDYQWPNDPDQVKEPLLNLAALQTPTATP